MLAKNIVAEQVLGNKYTLEKLLDAEPTLKDKILSFFKGASTDYADVPKLSSAAKKYYKTYKKLFDEFSARNYESNAISTEKSNYFSNDVSGKQYALYSNKVLDTIKKLYTPRVNLIQNITKFKYLR